MLTAEDGQIRKESSEAKEEVRLSDASGSQVARVSAGGHWETGP